MSGGPPGAAASSGSSALSSSLNTMAGMLTGSTSYGKNAPLLHAAMQLGMQSASPGGGAGGVGAAPPRMMRQGTGANIGAVPGTSTTIGALPQAAGQSANGQGSNLTSALMNQLLARQNGLLGGG